MDSDVIFYRYPSELFLKKPSFMKDYASRYVLSNEEIQYFFGLDPMFAVNVGVGVVDTKIIDNKLYYRIENSVRKVAKSRIVEGYFTEQTAYAILMKDIENFKHLPKEYFLLARRRFNKEAIPKNVICIHYTSIFKNQRVVDSLKYLLKTRCFKKVLNNNQFPTY